MFVYGLIKLWNIIRFVQKNVWIIECLKTNSTNILLLKLWRQDQWNVSKQLIKSLINL